MVQPSMSDGQPMTGIWYGCATYAVACICSISVPKLSLSTPARRSEYTTPRSLVTFSGAKSRLRMRSDSRSKMSPVAELGNQFWYTVTSELV